MDTAIDVTEGKQRRERNVCRKNTELIYLLSSMSLNMDTADSANRLCFLNVLPCGGRLGDRPL